MAAVFVISVSRATCGLFVGEMVRVGGGQEECYGEGTRTSSASPTIMASIAIWTSLVAGKYQIGGFRVRIRAKRRGRYLFLGLDIVL